MTAAAATSSSSQLFRLQKNLTILGSPGSGKGFYGSLLAAAWNVPLWTASSILRAQQQQQRHHEHVVVDLDSGRLVDCQRVSDAIQKHLTTNNRKNYILDGFPRTALQIQLMQATTTCWPVAQQVHVAVHLNVPDSVCLAKITGRRQCRVCGKSYNLAGFYDNGFDLPPQLPADCKRCDPTTDWTQRPDDADPVIVQERLALYKEHERPIVEHYERMGRLVRFTPYKGERDVPHMQATLESFLTKLQETEEEDESQ